MPRPRFLDRLFGQTPLEKAASALYLALVDQARQPVYYRDWAVPDTLDGRFDMIILHAALVIRRIKFGPGETPKSERDRITQSLFDYMFNDMDRSLREIGITDLGVGKRVKQMAAAFYGRAEAYQNALNAEEGQKSGELKDALARNVYRSAEPGDDQLTALSNYVIGLESHLDAQPLDDLMAARITFPDEDGVHGA